MQKNTFVIGIIFLFIVSAVTPIVFGYNVGISDQEDPISSSSYDDGLMDSAWPMFQHDTKHTGRSPYGKNGNWYIEKWKFYLDAFVHSSPSIDNNGIIYIGTYDFYALYLNGTLKWKFSFKGGVESSPAIDEEGIIYFGSEGADSNYFYALYPNGTLKWKYHIGNHVKSSPVIGNDGTIYFGSHNENIYALYPNGTLRWKYKTDGIVDDSLAIDDNGILYCGSNDHYLYAMYPNNGTVIWKYNAGCRIGSAPTIADDGAIYFGAVQKGALYALYPNGTYKWHVTLGSNVVSSPALAEDGTIYVAAYKGSHGAYIYSIKPNSSINWRYEVEDDAISASPAIDKYGIIYIGGWEYPNDVGGNLYALNPDGTLKWKYKIGDSIHGSAAIGEDGTIYIGAWDEYLYAIEPIDDAPPEKPNLNGPTSGKPGETYWFTAVTSDPDGDDVKYGFDWDGDEEVDEWTQDYYKSGETAEVNHSWNKRGTYDVRAIAKDIYELEGEWSDPLTITIPRDKTTTFNSLFIRFLEHFPLLEKVMSYLIV